MPTKNTKTLNDPYTALQFLVMNSPAEIRQQASIAIGTIKRRLDACESVETELAQIRTEAISLRDIVRDLQAELSALQFQPTVTILKKTKRTTVSPVSVDESDESNS